MNYATFFSRQARKPTGVFGRFYMSRVFEKGNAELNDLTFESLAVAANEHILEIGCGTGLLIKRIAGHETGALIEGIDFSKSMVALAHKNNRRHIKRGKVAIHLGDFAQVTFQPDAFDKVFTVNTVYFWKNPEAILAKIHRVLKPGGRLIIGFHEKSEMEKMPLNKDVFKYYSTQDMKELLAGHGSLEDTEVISRKGARKVSYCAVCSKAVT
ncbi:MAG: class I SAM-dependent methyltransferase [Desulfarculaceae bacterium]|nr:class I SAM-dependent methyltransferase [Desulfarculaceae bacterium]